MKSLQGCLTLLKAQTSTTLRFEISPAMFVSSNFIWAKKMYKK